MRFVCDAAGGKAWFRIETEAEAARASELVNHAVEKHFRRAREQASQTYTPAPAPFVEQDIGREAHIRRSMPMFLTLHAAEGAALATAMLPPQPAGRDGPALCRMIVGPENIDPCPEHWEAIRSLGRHFGLALGPSHCYPYGRR
jgi:hypothetical protein